ncbi:hypothetical protein WMY93_029447 [Mugilogobius chulae]|uniref:Uncharacterized protein n=1 Tax=Mugilogobius chulae TaxID=88201 RepID=A0AAW0MY02_9GOBI
MRESLDINVKHEFLGLTKQSDEKNKRERAEAVTAALCLGLLLPSSEEHHGPLSTGAFPQFHDCLNHRATDVAACQVLPD